MSPRLSGDEQSVILTKARASGATQETFLGTTDAKGELRAQIAPGNYDLLAYLDLYSGIRKRVKVRAARNRPLTIELNR